MKTIFLTQDYEIFFGNDSGTVNECMIKPVEKLIKLLGNYNYSMTVFWDVLHYYILKVNVSKYPELQSDIDLIENQIKLLIENNHDVQLHIHPHWLDAKYAGNNKWHFSYERYDLHNLCHENNPEDISTISGCVNKSVLILKSFVKDEKSPIIFRAGGNQIEPFNILADTFSKYSVNIDSSKVGMPHKCNQKKTFYKPYYTFSATPSVYDDHGHFYEFPITTINISLIRKLWFKFQRKDHRYLDKFGNGTSMGETVIQRPNIFERAIKFVSNSKAVLTPEGNFTGKFNYLIRRCPDFSLMTLHPKFLNQHQIDMLNSLLENKKVRFTSIRNYIDNNKIC